MSILVKRDDNHRIDTIATRRVLGVIPADWLVRGLEERDYGIDLQVEIFEGDQPTGSFALIQNKGKEKAFGKTISLQFPVRTLTYAEMFQQPFFVFYTSISSNKTYFIWLQQYIAVELDRRSQSWRDQETVVLKFPKTNVLADNFQKIEDVMKRYSLRRDGLEYIASYEWLERHNEQIFQRNFGVIPSALLVIDKIKKQTRFIERYSAGLEDLNILELRESLIDIQSQGDFDEDTANAVDHQVENLKLIKFAFLEEDDIALFAHDEGGETAY